jgi:RNA recognition motif-containing protein
VKPVPTLYIRNLCEKIKPKGKQKSLPYSYYDVNNRMRWNIEMKISLYHLLATYGEVIEIAVRETANLRGQAFATFRDQDMADRAMKELSGFNLFGNKIVTLPPI